MLDRLDFATRTPSGNLLLRLLRDFGREHVPGLSPGGDLPRADRAIQRLDRLAVAARAERHGQRGNAGAHAFPRISGARSVRAARSSDLRLHGDSFCGSATGSWRPPNGACSSACSTRTSPISRIVIPASSSHGSRSPPTASCDALQLVIQGFMRATLVTVTGLLFVMVARDPKMALGALLALSRGCVLCVSRILRRVREFAKRSYEGSTQIVQTMGKPCWARASSDRSNLEGEMRERMSRAIRTVERSANRDRQGRRVGDAVSRRLARRLRDRFRHFLRLVARRGSARATSGRFASSSWARSCWPTSPPNGSAAFPSISRTVSSAHD